MAIAFSCACGKQLRARDEFAGRKIRCPGCQTVLTIPAQTAADAQNAEEPEGSVSEPYQEESPGLVPLAKPATVTTPVVSEPETYRFADGKVEVKSWPTATAVKSMSSPWVDRSLDQTPTEWREGDRERFNEGMEFDEGASRLWLILVAIFVVIALTAAILMG